MRCGVMAVVAGYGGQRFTRNTGRLSRAQDTDLDEYELIGAGGTLLPALCASLRGAVGEQGVLAADPLPRRSPTSPTRLGALRGTWQAGTPAYSRDSPLPRVLCLGMDAEQLTATLHRQPGLSHLTRTHIAVGLNVLVEQGEAYEVSPRRYRLTS